MDTGAISSTIETSRLPKISIKPDHTLENVRLAVIKKVNDKIKEQREVEEQKIIIKFG